MKSVYSFCLVGLLALSLLLGCAKPTTPDSSSATGTPAAGAPAAPATGGAATGSKAASGATAEPRKPAPEALTLPAGTVIHVRLGETLSSNHSQPGQDFSATVAEPVSAGGRTVIEQGASAHGIVVDAKGMGHFKGGALLEVRLNSVTIKGKEHAIETAALERTTKGKGKRSATIIGGGAAAGAIIGALAGGGKGAAIGAAAGAGAGTAGAAYTGNKDIVFPAETVLSFKLTQPVQVH